MDLTFLTPEAAAVGVLAAAPLAALAVVARRAGRVRAVLRLGAPGRRPGALAAAAIVAAAGLLAFGAAQPVLSSVDERPARTDAQAFFLLDTSRSMMASSDQGGATRLARAKRAALRLRDALAAVPTGVASLTDRALPHLLPTSDHALFEATVRRAIAIDSPPPAAVNIVATTYDPLYQLATTNFFPAGLERRIVVVLTDGEAQPPTVEVLKRAVPWSAGWRIVFVHVWGGDERIWDEEGELEAAYRPDARSRRTLDRLARALRAEVFDERELEEAAEALRRAAGSGPSVVEADSERRVVLAPYATAVAFLPLAFLLWSRNRP